MDSNERNDRLETHDPAYEANQTDARMQADLPSSTIIGATIAGINTAPFPGGVVAPAAEQAAEEAIDNDIDELNLDALDQFASRHRRSGDDGVSANQRELEADELNG